MVYDNCDVYLEGSLSTMPAISKNRFGETEVTISRSNYDSDKVEFYRVILNWEDATQIINYGYLGMFVTIYGALRGGHEIEIIAEKVIFISFSNKGSLASIPKKTHSVRGNVPALSRNLYTVH